MGSDEYEIASFVKELENSINDCDLDRACFLTDEYWKKKFPCSIIVEEAEKIDEFDNFFQYVLKISNPEKSPYEIIDNDIENKLVSLGYSKKIAMEGATGTTSLAEASKKILLNSSGKSQRRY